MGRYCGEPDEIKENTHPKYITALSVEQASFNTFQHRFRMPGKESKGTDGNSWYAMQPVEKGR